MMSSSSNLTLYQAEPSSPSSVYLPPLLDSSPFSAAGAAIVNDRNSCSNNTYDSLNNNNNTINTSREHVSCFSTISATNNNNNYGFDLSAADPFARFMRNGGAGGGGVSFPSLRSLQLQDSLQLPFFIPPVVAPPQQQPFQGIPVDMNWATPVVAEQRVVDGGGGGSGITSLGGGSELDCMWGF